MHTKILASTGIILLATFGVHIAAAQTAATISISPNPIQVCDGSTNKIVTVTANAGVDYDIRINSPQGDLFARQAANTQTIKQTGAWVMNGMTFYLVDTNAGNTLASVQANFSNAGCPVSASITLAQNPMNVCYSNIASTTVTGSASVDYEVHINDPVNGTLFAKKTANSALQQATGNWITNGMVFYLVDSNSHAVLASTTAAVNSTQCSVANSASPFNSIRSVTWYEFGPTFQQSMSNLQQQLPRIKRAGFNTVWLVVPWAEMNPQPLATPAVYNDQSFASLTQTLGALRSNGMQALIGLDYLGQGWSPQEIDACTWVTNPTMEKSFENYAAEFLRRIDGYQDVANIMLFTENAEPCNLNAYNNAQQIASLLQSTLGSLPTRLPSDLRSKFRIGYHDYDLLNLGWANGQSPIINPNPFDFVSMVAYDLEQKSDADIQNEVNARAYRFKSLYPTTPLIIGELGARSCDSSQDQNQARVDADIVKTAISDNFGFNVWGWKPATANDCAMQVSGYGYNLLNLDGSPRVAATTIANILGGNIILPPVLAPSVSSTPVISTSTATTITPNPPTAISTSTVVNPLPSPSILTTSASTTIATNPSAAPPLPNQTVIRTRLLQLITQLLQLIQQALSQGLITKQAASDIVIRLNGF